MWATSSAFDAALVSPSRVWRSRVEVLYGAQLVTALDVVVDGSVSYDDVAVRRSGDLRLIDLSGTLTPVSANDLLTPKGTEVRLAKGLWLPDRSIEWVPLGVLGIEEPEISAHDGATRISLKAFDRVAAIRARRFDQPYTITEGTATTTAIVDIVTSRLTVPTRVVATGHTTPEVTYEELSDPWEAVQKLATADALRAYFDPLGTLVVEPDLPVNTGVVYDDGPDSLLVKCRRTINAEKTYSGVIVKGEHPDHPPVRVELWDTDPTSPTYADGPFGRRPYGFTSQLIVDEAMAYATATTLMSRVTGMYHEVELEVVGHPGHDVGDQVAIDDPKSRTHGSYVVIRGKTSLRPGTGSLTLRRL